MIKRGVYHGQMRQKRLFFRKLMPSRKSLSLLSVFFRFFFVLYGVLQSHGRRLQTQSVKRNPIVVRLSRGRDEFLVREPRPATQSEKRDQKRIHRRVHRFRIVVVFVVTTTITLCLVFGRRRRRVARPQRSAPSRRFF